MRDIMEKKHNHVSRLITSAIAFALVTLGSFAQGSTAMYVKVNEGTKEERTIPANDLINSTVVVYSRKEYPLESRQGIVKSITDGAVYLETEYGDYSDFINDVAIITKEGYKEYTTSTRHRIIREYGERQVKKYIPKHSVATGLTADDEYLDNGTKRIPLQKIKILSESLNDKPKLFDFIVRNNPSFKTTSLDIGEHDKALSFVLATTAMRGGLEISVFITDEYTVWSINHKAVKNLDELTEFGFILNGKKIPVARLANSNIQTVMSKNLKKLEYSPDIKMYFDSPDPKVFGSLFEISNKTYTETFETLMTISAHPITTIKPTL